MLRALIGTAAVLAGFAVLERSIDAGSGRAGSCAATQDTADLQTVGAQIDGSPGTAHPEERLQGAPRRLGNEHVPVAHPSRRSAARCSSD